MNLNPRRMFTSLVVLAVLAASVPALADDQHHRSASGRTVQQAPARQAAPQAQPRQAPPPASRGGFAPRAPQGQPARPQVVPRGSAAPQASVAPRGYAVPRGSVAPAPGYSHGYGYAVPRAYHPPVVVAPRYAYPYYARPRYVYPYSYPYYAFHSHFSLSFGFFVGYPVAYPTWYNPYAYGTFGYGVPYGVAYGGLSFNVQPYDAAVFVDGVFVGAAADFGPQAAPLTLRAGLHHIELRAGDAQPLAFDITVVPGQVIPYQGTLPIVR